MHIVIMTSIHYWYMYGAPPPATFRTPLIFFLTNLSRLLFYYSRQQRSCKLFHVVSSSVRNAEHLFGNPLVTPTFVFSSKSERYLECKPQKAFIVRPLRMLGAEAEHVSTEFLNVPQIAFQLQSNDSFQRWAWNWENAATESFLGFICVIKENMSETKTQSVVLETTNPIFGSSCIFRLKKLEVENVYRYMQTTHMFNESFIYSSNIPNR